MAQPIRGAMHWWLANARSIMAGVVSPIHKPQTSGGQYNLKDAPQQRRGAPINAWDTCLKKRPYNGNTGWQIRQEN